MLRCAPRPPGGPKLDDHLASQVAPLGRRHLGGIEQRFHRQRRGRLASLRSLCPRSSMVSLRQASLGKEEETRTWKPFVGTLRVRIPPGKAGPAARSESCVAVGRPTLRSVDSEVKGRVIEPRNYKLWGAFVLDTGGGRVRRVALGPTGRVWSYRGRRARTMTTRVLQEPERPRRFHRNTGWGDRYRQLPGPRWDAPGRGERNTGETMVSAREAFETSRNGRRGVGASRSIVEAGEP